MMKKVLKAVNNTLPIGEHQIKLSSETMEARRKWHILQVLKEKNCQPRIPYPVKLSFVNEGKIKTFSDEGNL